MSSFDLMSYDTYLIMMSGGKDSVACVLDLLRRGVPREKMELWHHKIDGENDDFMDWPSTPSYCEALAIYLGIPIYHSWKVGGFRKEMLRDNEPTSATSFEHPTEDNVVECGLVGGTSKNLSTRRKFPQVTGDLRLRWCSGYLKISVATTAITNQKRFRGKRTLVITGERAEESPQRAKYKQFEPDRADLRNGKKYIRHVDRYRPMLYEPELTVWELMALFNVNPHPAYHLGWGRLSCMACIFGNKHQWASLNHIHSARFKEIADYEKDFGVTIHRTKALEEHLTDGIPYKGCADKAMVALALNPNYPQHLIRLDPWKLPSGAFGDKTGPT